MGATKFKKMKTLLLKVVSRDDLGRPKKLEVVYDEEVVDLSKPENREFITALVDPKVVSSKLQWRA